jgi:hypothetical protein
MIVTVRDEMAELSSENESFSSIDSAEFEAVIGECPER